MSSELRGKFSAALARVDDNLESQAIHKAVVEKLRELVILRAQESDAKGRLFGRLTYHPTQCGRAHDCQVKRSQAQNREVFKPAQSTEGSR
jgi:hypothetical protein